MTEIQAKILFFVSLTITYAILVLIIIEISLLVGVWAPWWVYVIELVLVFLIGWDMTTWQGSEANMELP